MSSNQLSAFNYVSPPFALRPIKNISAAYLVNANDNGYIINCTSGTFTVSLTAAATLGSGFNCWIWNTGTGAITIDPNSTETIDGVSTLILRQGEGTQIVCNGTNWDTGDKKTMRGYAENLPTSHNRPVATGNGSVAIGNSHASGTDSFAVAIGNNVSTVGATNANAVALGNGAFVSGLWSGAFGYLARATGSASLAIARDAVASGSSSVAINGGTASATRSMAVGKNAKAELIGKYAYAGEADFGASSIYSQEGLFILLESTTTTTSVVLTTDRIGTPSTNNQVILPNNSAYAFTGIIVARRQASGGTESAAWKVEGLIRREGAANTTTLVASTVTAISNAPGWTLALSADTTNGGLAVTATGAAATNIRWVATIQTSEVTYA